jgi:hypothetical protein
MKGFGFKLVFSVVSLFLVSLVVYTGCTSSGSGGRFSGSALFITDTFTGEVFYYDTVTGALGAGAFVTTGQNSTGKIFFYEGMGYVCVGSFGSETPGIYRFDPEAEVPAADHFSEYSMDAQFICFLNDTTAYVTNFDGGIYKFDPSSIDSAFTLVDGTDAYFGLQDVCLAGDGHLYAADSMMAQVIEVDPSDDSIVESSPYAATRLGTTKLFPLDGESDPLVYILNNGGYVEDPPESGNWIQGPGSLDELNTSSKEVTSLIDDVNIEDIAPYTGDKGLVYYVTTGSETYVVTPDTPDWTEEEIRDDESALFGGTELIISDDKVYISGNYGDALYIVDAETGSFTSKVTLHGATIAGMALY